MRLELDKYEIANLLSALEFCKFLNTGDWYHQVIHQLKQVQESTTPDASKRVAPNSSNQDLTERMLNWIDHNGSQR